MHRLAQETHTDVVELFIQFPAFRLALDHVGQEVDFVQAHLFAQDFDGAVGVSDGGRIVLHHDEAALACTQESQYGRRNTGGHIDDQVIHRMQRWSYHVVQLAQVLTIYWFEL